MTDALLHELKDRVLTISFNRPDKKNALTLAMYDTLTELLETAAADSQTRVVLLRGEAGVFTAGNDLGDFMKNPPSSADSPVGRFLAKLVSFAKPVLAAVDGIAIGVGVTMLLHCDLVYAATGTKLKLPFVPLGLCPEAGSSYLLPRLAGGVRASELLLLGEGFGAQEALSFGLVNAVLEPAQLHEHARQRALTLAKLPPASVRATKALIRQGMQAPIETAMARESDVFFERLRSPEAAESMQAFFGKRAPDFSRFE